MKLSMNPSEHTEKRGREGEVAEPRTTFVVRPIRSVLPAVWILLFLGGVLIVLWALAFVLPQGYFLKPAASWGFLELGGLSVVVGVGYWVFTKSRYPESITYTVDRRTIVRESSDGARMVGEWKDLVEVRMSTRQLVFDDGAVMPMNDLFLRSREPLLPRIVELSGKDSLLTRAWEDCRRPLVIPGQALATAVSVWLLVGVTCYVLRRDSVGESLVSLDLVELVTVSVILGFYASMLCLFPWLIYHNRASLRERERAGRYRGN